jgi:hypothetical protein
MGDEKRVPFVVYRGDDEEGDASPSWSLYVGGVRVPTRFEDPDGNYGHNIETAAEAIRAAVEKREAALRGALGDLVALSPPSPCDPGECRHRVCLAHHVAKAALGPNPPEYVPRAQLDEANAKLVMLQKVVDLLDAREGINTATLVAWLEASGLRKPPGPEELSDDELVRQLKALTLEHGRRIVKAELRPERQLEIVNQMLRNGLLSGGDALGAIAPYAHCAHCNDLPYDGPTLACPECGIDRHGVGHGAG